MKKINIPLSKSMQDFLKKIHPEEKIGDLLKFPEIDIDISRIINLIEKIENKKLNLSSDDFQSEKIILFPNKLIIAANEEISYVKESQQLKKIISDIYEDNRNLYKIEPRAFERIIAELLNKQGFDVELTKQTRDNGYDIIAIKKLEDHSPMKFLVECKRNQEKNKVGIDVVRSFMYTSDKANVNRGIIVTTSYLTRDAIKEIDLKGHLFDYKDKNDILLWIKKYLTSA